jgi:hypothetical protein
MCSLTLRKGCHKLGLRQTVILSRGSSVHYKKDLSLSKIWLALPGYLGFAKIEYLATGRRALAVQCAHPTGGSSERSKLSSDGLFELLP